MPHALNLQIQVKEPVKMRRSQHFNGQKRFSLNMLIFCRIFNVRGAFNEMLLPLYFLLLLPLLDMELSPKV